MRCKQHIIRVFSTFLLLVFMFVLTPWGILHHHQATKKIVEEKHCTHKFHIQNSKSECFICSVHFEKIFLHHIAVSNYFNQWHYFYKISPVSSVQHTPYQNISPRAPPFV